MLISVFLIFVFSSSCLVRGNENSGVLEKIKSGLQYAKNYLESAKEIADLVSQSLGQRKLNGNKKMNNNEKRGDDGKNDGISKETERPNLLSGFFRLLGLDSPKITAIAINSVIFLAQMISSLFGVKPRIEQSRSRGDEPPFDPMNFIIENKNEKIKNLVSQAQDPALPSQLLERLDGFDSACVRLLLCKCTPIILAAQNSLRMSRSVERRFDITSWLPRMQDFEDNADNCDEKHTDCVLFPESA